MSGPDCIVAGTDEPISAHDNVDGTPRACRRCGYPNASDVGRCTRCQSFLTGNQEAVTTGVHRREQPIDIRLSAAELVAGIVADLGGLEELSTLERAYVGRISEVDTVLRLLVNDMVTTGLFTPAGSVRGVYDKWLAGIDRLDRLAQRVGLKRRARRLHPLERLRAQMNPDPVDGSDDAAAAQPGPYAKPVGNVTQEAADA